MKITMDLSQHRNLSALMWMVRNVIFSDLNVGLSDQICMKMSTRKACILMSMSPRFPAEVKTKRRIRRTKTLLPTLSIFSRRHHASQETRKAESDASVASK